MQIYQTAEQWNDHPDVHPYDLPKLQLSGPRQMGYEGLLLHDFMHRASSLTIKPFVISNNLSGSNLLDPVGEILPWNVTPRSLSSLLPKWLVSIPGPRATPELQTGDLCHQGKEICVPAIQS